MSVTGTRVFELARAYGYTTSAALARAMGVHESVVSRVRNDRRAITPAFIAGSLRAFPDKTFSELFFESTDSLDAAS